MRKQLMTGVAAAAICLGLSNCSRYDFTPINEGEQAYANYENAFIEKFGEPAPDQTWGFGSADANNGGVAQGAATRTANTNSNEWANTYNVPAEITDAERKYVMEWFATHTKAEGEPLDVKNYFIQHVGYSDDQYTVNNNVYEKFENNQEIFRTETSTVNSKNQMDFIYANLNADGSERDHVNNFNAGSGDIMLMVNSETKYGFGFHDSWGSIDNYVTQNYFMAEIDVPGVGKGWYVGLDYQTKKTTWNGHTQQNYVSAFLQPDGKYTDRVLKIVPAILKGDIRIIAEDLSASEGSDFDFNDVVFDVKYNYPEYGKTAIILQAAGGKLPLCIGVNIREVENYEKYEVHNLFGVTGNTMVNTEEWTAHKAPVTIIIDEKYNNENIGELPIWVRKGNTWCLLTAEQGKAASKIAVPTTFNWVKELKDIEGVYPDFKNYVSNPSIQWWNTISDNSQIYNAQ